MKKLLLVIAVVCVATVGFSARAQDIINPNNTVVRFDFFNGGTNFGSIDLELFDQDKPETVRNFLTYVYSGGYSNIALHRLIPNFVLQAGHVQITNAFSTNRFHSYPLWKDFGRITNEYDVGPELLNDFGTLAMARIDGQTNSASVDWFINLTNNTTLNRTNYGGFTVFGHVVNTAGERTGTNLLNYFNTLSKLTLTNVGEVILTNGIGFAGTEYNELLFDLPVTTMRADGAVYADLILMRPSFLNGGVARDGTAPTLQINQPATSPVVTTNATITFSGTAGDNQELARVLYDTPEGRSFVANGKENWTAEVPLIPGTNKISMRSVDYFGNLSTNVERTVFYSFPRRVNFELIGKGKVTGITNRQEFLVGVTYQLVAKPAPGQFFAGWGGDFTTRDRIVYFTMWEGLSNITATFTRTLLGLSNGVYNGLFYSHTNGPPHSAGWISLNLSAKGEYFGRLAPLGANYQIHGKFDGNGTSTIYGQRGTTLVALQIVVYPEAEAILGLYFDGAAYSDVALWRVQKFGGSNLPPAGNYSFTISPTRDTNRVTVADGSGFGTVTIDARGKIKMTGTLADETSIRQNSALLKGNRWPFFASFKGRGGVLGWASFNTNNVFNADVKWFSQSFPGGTNQNARLSGSPYTPPSQARLFDWTNGIVTLSGDGLIEPISADVLLNEDGSFTVPGNTHNIQLRVTDANGLLTGSFTHPVSNTLTPLKGAVLQSSNTAAGYFPGTPRDGSLLIQRAP